MRILLILLTLFTAMADSCLAENVSRSENSAIGSSVSNDDRSTDALTSNVPCTSHGSGQSSEKTHQCHLGHCGIIFGTVSVVSHFETLLLPSPYVFAFKSVFLFGKKRPPRFNS